MGVHRQDRRLGDSPIMGRHSYHFGGGGGREQQRIQLPTRVKEVRGILKRQSPKQLHPTARTNDSDMVQDEGKNLITGSTLITIHPAVSKSIHRTEVIANERSVIGHPAGYATNDPYGPGLPSLNRRNVLAPASHGRSDMHENARHITDATSHSRPPRHHDVNVVANDQACIARSSLNHPSVASRLTLTSRGTVIVPFSPVQGPSASPSKTQSLPARENMQPTAVSMVIQVAEEHNPETPGMPMLNPSVIVAPSAPHVNKEIKSPVFFGPNETVGPIYSPPICVSPPSAPPGLFPQSGATSPTDMNRGASVHTASTSTFSSTASPTPAQIMQQTIAINSGRISHRHEGGVDRRYFGGVSNGFLAPPSQKSHLLRSIPAVGASQHTAPSPSFSSVDGATTGANPSSYSPVFLHGTPRPLLAQVPQSSYTATVGACPRIVSPEPTAHVPWRPPPAASPLAVEGGSLPATSRIQELARSNGPHQRVVAFSGSTASGSNHESASPIVSPELISLKQRLRKLEAAEQKNLEQRRLHTEYVKTLQTELTELRAGRPPALSQPYYHSNTHSAQTSSQTSVSPRASYIPPRQLQPSPFLQPPFQIGDGRMRAPLPAWADENSRVHEPLHFQKVCRDGEDLSSSRLSSYTTSASDLRRGRHHGRSRRRSRYHHSKNHHSRSRGNSYSPSRGRRRISMDSTEYSPRGDGENSGVQMASGQRYRVTGGGRSHSRRPRQQHDLPPLASPEASTTTHFPSTKRIAPPAPTETPPRNEMEMPPPAVSRRYWQMPTVDDLQVPSVASSGHNRRQQRRPVFPTIEGETESAIENRIGNLNYMDDGLQLPSEEDPAADYVTVHNVLKPMRKQPQCCG